MREHPFLASPLHTYGRNDGQGHEAESHDVDVRFARQRYDETYTLPSDLCDGGKAGWSSFEAGDDGWVSVQYPRVR